MPTIALSTTRSPSAATAAKGAPTIIGLGSAGGSFAALLDGSSPGGDGATATARQPVAVCGIALPVTPAPPTAIADPVPVVIDEVPAPTVPRAPLTVDALPDPVVIEDEPMVVAAEPRIALPLIAPKTPVPTIADIAVATTALTPVVPNSKAASDTEDKIKAVDADSPAVAPTIPIIPFLTPSPIVTLRAPVPTGAAKASPQPIISIAKESTAETPAAPSPPPTPQLGRDIQWTSIAAAVPTVAPVAASRLTPATASAAPVAITPAVNATTSPVSVAPPIVLPIAAQADPVATAPIVSGPALQVFGAAIQAAARRDKLDATTADPASSIAGIAPAPAPTSIAAVGDAAAQPQLDMGHPRWPHAMVDHIEQLRDAANAADTRIRLIPDALGTIDVSVKRDGDTVHVHFAAEQAATRTLIQDAQPRLAAIAEERGLRLGQTAVDAGATGSNPQQPRQPPRDATTSPTPRRATTTTTTDDADTGRLA